MHESEQERELAAWEARLSAFRPGPTRLDRDRVMYLAGRASAKRERAGAARPRTRWTWPAALAGMTAVAGCLLVALVIEHRGDTPPVPGVSGAAAQQTPPVPVPVRRGTPGDREDREVPAAERQPVVWPGVGESETLTVRSPRWEEADRMSPQLAEHRLLDAAWESASPPGSFGPPVGPDPPRRPRSYVERRRMLLEELECLGETSARTPFRHPPTGV
jgi:hypothetical protein